MEKEVTKAVATKNGAVPSVFQFKATNTPIIDSADIVVPKLLLCQAMSKATNNGQAQAGQIINSLTGQVVGGKGKKFTIIPITVKKQWRTIQDVGGKRVFRGYTDFTKGQKKEWKEIGPNKEQYENDLCLDFYCFTEDDLKNPGSLPCVISFSRTSYKQGQRLATFVATLANAGEAFCARMYTLDTTKAQNDKGIWFQFSIDPHMTDGKHTNTPTVYAEKIGQWLEILESKTIEVDNTEVDDGAGAEQANSFGV